MFFSSISLKLKRLRRRFDISAPNVVVRTHLPGYFYGVLTLLFCGLVLCIFWLLVRFNIIGCAAEEIETLRLRLSEMEVEHNSLRSTAGTGQNLALMERSTQQQLLLRVKALEAENAALIEDMLIFDRLIPVPGQEPMIRVENFRLLKESDGRVRYRLLLAFQSAKKSPKFKGRLQFGISYRSAGAQHHIKFPDAPDTAGGFSIEMQQFWRKEGVFDLPQDASLVEVQVKVLQGDVLKAEQFGKL